MTTDEKRATGELVACWSGEGPAPWCATCGNDETCADILTDAEARWDRQDMRAAYDLVWARFRGTVEEAGSVGGALVPEMAGWVLNRVLGRLDERLCEDGEPAPAVFSPWDVRREEAERGERCDRCGETFDQGRRGICSACIDRHGLDDDDREPDFLRTLRAEFADDWSY